ncbi:MAG: hypothetical protein PGN11_19860 [Quadrisphaera sp.]
MNTPAVATLLMLAEQVEWMLDRGGLEWAAARSAESASRLYEWAEASQYARPRGARTARCARRWSAPSTSTRRSTPPPSARCCARTAWWTSSRTAGWAATSCAWACSPAVDPHDVSALTACVDHVVSALS